MKIDIRSIPHNEQRYETSGDYYEEDDTLYIRVSAMSDWKHELLIVIHELVEATIVANDGVDICDVDTFDIEYEENRKDGDTSEPGDDPNAPYYYAHQIATGIERILAAEMEVNWKDYELACNRVSTTLAHKS